MSDPSGARLRQELVDAGHLIPTSVPGLYGRSGGFEDLVRRIDQRITRAGAHLAAEVMRFPPVLDRDAYLATGHLDAMPHLMGSVHSFAGDEADHVALMAAVAQGGAWTELLEPTNVVLVPAACYPVYPTATGTLPARGRTVDVRGYVFRHEPSQDPARMLAFRQREYVRLGSPEQALSHRDEWLRRAREIHEELALPVEAVVASDSFFGRGGRLLQASQVERALKHEIVTPLGSGEGPSAIASVNYHRELFGRAFDIRTADGEPAHSACVGFGLERTCVALLRRHGMRPERWPAEVRGSLGM